ARDLHPQRPRRGVEANVVDDVGGVDRDRQQARRPPQPRARAAAPPVRAESGLDALVEGRGRRRPGADGRLGNGCAHSGSTNSAKALPLKALFAMNPFFGASSSAAPRSDALLLEVSTTAVARSVSASSAAISRPERS